MLVSLKNSSKKYMETQPRVENQQYFIYANIFTINKW